MDILGAAKVQQVDARQTVATPPMKQTTAPGGEKEGEKTEKTSGERAAVQAKETQLGAREKIERIAMALQEYVQANKRELNIKIHEKTGTIMVQVLSKSDGRIIREIPSEEVLNLAARIEEMVGVLFDANA
jgi:flagellar protein FlaG